MQPQSLYREAFQASRAYRDEVVGRMGATHGEAAVAEWNRHRFWLWALDRVVEHVLGERMWSECDARNFARAGRQPGKIHETVDNLRELKKRLGNEGLPGFQEKERLIADLSELANDLLD